MSEAVTQYPGDPGPPSRGSSVCSLSVEPRTPFDSEIAGVISSTSPGKNSNTTIPTSSSRGLAEGMDVDEIISKGLGISSGHRDQSLPSNCDAKHTLQDNFTAEEEESSVSNDYSSTTTIASGLTDPVEKKKKKKKSSTSRRSTGGRKEGSKSALLEANKENHCSGL